MLWLGRSPLSVHAEVWKNGIDRVGVVRDAMFQQLANNKTRAWEEEERQQRTPSQARSREDCLTRPLAVLVLVHPRRMLRSLSCR